MYTSGVICYRLDECVPANRFLLKADIFLKQYSELFLFLALTFFLFFFYICSIDYWTDRRNMTESMTKAALTTTILS